VSWWLCGKLFSLRLSVFAGHFLTAMEAKVSQRAQCRFSFNFALSSFLLSLVALWQNYFLCDFSNQPVFLRPLANAVVISSNFLIKGSAVSGLLDLSFLHAASLSI
jgi:hypothetical protein